MTLYDYFTSKMNPGQPVIQQPMNMFQQATNKQTISGMPQNLTPMQKMQMAMQAMQNPAAFVKQAFPDIPNAIQNNPNQILQYLQQTRNITNGQIQQTMQQMPR